MSELMDTAAELLVQARSLGVDEASVVAARGTQTTLTRRAGQVEQASSATSRGVTLSLMVDGRFSSHSTSDLRPDALAVFLRRAVDATRYVEPDPERAQPPGELCGRGVSVEQLDQDDPAWGERTPEQRGAAALGLEQAVDAAAAGEDVISHATHVADGRSESARVMTNGFADESAGAWFSAAAELTLRDGERRPEAGAGYGARHLADLPTSGAIAAEATERARERLGSGPVASERLPLVLPGRAAGRLLGVLAAALSGRTLHEGRSCLADAMDTPIGSAPFTLIDDPTLPRGLGSRPWDGDALRARRRVLVQDGVLREWQLSVYFARKLGLEPTSGSRSNWVVPPGEVPTDELVAALPRAVRVTGFLGGNSNAATGDFSFGIRGQLLEHGEVTRSLSEMNVTGNLTRIFHRLSAVGDDPWVWSSTRSPTLVFDAVQFTGT